jgi:hypothetical protein
MNYAFKMMAVGVLLLQGCQTTKHNYVGEYKDGQYHGYGSISFLSGEIYEGDWKFGKRNGQGTNIWKDGNKYIGGWSNDLRHGYGKEIFSTGNRYEGEYRNNEFHGYGKYFFINGETYSGEYKFGKRNGKGTNIWPNRNKYSGEFLNEKRHGNGIFTYNDGRKVSGIWKNDVIFKKLEIKPFTNKAWIGVRIEQLTKERSYDLGLRNTFGALIVSVDSDSPASDAGLKSQDVILNFNTKKIMKMQDLPKFVSLTPIGQSVTLTVWRDRKTIQKNVILADSGYLMKDNFLVKSYKNEKQKIDAINHEAESEKQRRIELERKLAVFENKQKQEQQRIDTDTRAPFLEIISNKTRGKRGTIRGIAKDNVEVAEVTVDGKPVNISSAGNFEYSTYVPSQGVELKLEVTDVAGLTTSKVVSLKGDLELANPSISFDRLNPISKKVKPNPKALALIVGVSNYENTKAEALYADNDAMVFKDYATEKLGISENRIKVLLNNKADEKDILLSVQEWLRRSAKPNKSDIYVFFAGHGLASQDGKNMYLLPHDGSPRLLEKTAILRDELFSDIKEANPKSVTVFLDTCYSGVTRNEEMLIAGRPIMIKAKEQSIPDGFTLFSAASNEQISRPLEEAKHGMFSYFLMKGMEGDADTNNDNKITARELHAYVEQNVVQQSSGSQTPELQGDKDRVLVQFN